MTSASSVRGLKCSICLETYKQPRKLPGCSHSFCETCIATFIDELKTEDKPGLEFQCPVCRLPSKAPEDQDVISEWVKKMDRDTELEAQAHGEVKDTQCELCNTCKHLAKMNTSKYYCLNCEEYLCVGCSDILHAVKQNRNHIIIEAKSDKSERFHKPALELMSQLLTCSEHSNSRMEFYCEDHSQTACYKCVTVKHRACSYVKDIMAMPQFTLQTALAKVSKSVTTQVDYIKQITSTYKQNEDQNKINIETIHIEIQTIKQNIVKLLDALEDNLEQSSSAMTKAINLTYLEEADDLKCMLQQLNIMDHLIKSCLASATPDQIFVCIEGLNKICQESEQRIIEKGKTLKTQEVCLKLHDVLTSILHLGPNETTQLANIEEKESVVSLAKYRAVYDRKHCEIKKVGCRRIVAEGGGSTPTYNDLLYLQNNNLLLVDSFYGNCCLVDEQFIERGTRRFVSTADPKLDKEDYFRKMQYATCLEKDRVAVSMCIDKKVCLASSNDLGVIVTIDCKYIPKCMAGLDNNVVAISWGDPVAFGIIEINDNTYSDKVYFTSDNVGRKLKSFDYMAVDKDLRHVIQPCNVDKAVYCFNFSGNPVFTYKPKTLEEPRGVAVDTYSKVYICDNEGAGIHIVSPSGVPIKVIKDGCPYRPLAISFSLKCDTFAVSESSTWATIHFFALDSD